MILERILVPGHAPYPSDFEEPLTKSRKSEFATQRKPQQIKMNCDSELPIEAGTTGQKKTQK